MKNIKRIKKLSAVLLSSLICFSSCNRSDDIIQPDIKYNNVAQNTENIFEYKLSSESMFDTDFILCDSLAGQYNDGFVFIGSASPSCSEFSVLSKEFGSQEEKSLFKADTDIADVISVKKKDDIIYFLCGKNGKGSVISFDENGKQKEMIELSFYPSCFEINEKIYILNSASSSIEVYSDKLVYEESFDISYDSDKRPIFPYMMAISQKDEVYCAVSDKSENPKTEIISAGNENSVVYSTYDTDTFNNFFVNSKGNIVIAENENNKCFIDEIDKNGNIVSMFELSDCEKIYGITDNDEIIFSVPEGIFAFFNGEKEMLISSENFEGNDIFACFAEKDGCTVYLSSSFEKYNAVFITDKDNKIISEIKADRIDDCFVKDNIVYISGIFDGEHTLKIFADGNITDTGIELDDERQMYKIGVLPSGDIILNFYDGRKFDIYSDSFEKKDSKNIDIYVSGFFTGKDSLYCYDEKNIYRFNEKYQTEKTDIDIGVFGNNAVFSSGNGEYEFLFSVSGKVYGYKISDNSFVFLTDHNNGILSDVNSFIALKDTRIILSSFWHIYEAEKCEVEKHQDTEKQTLTLAYYDTHNRGLNDFKKAVKTFNDLSDKYIIEMKGYSSTENSSSQSIFERDILSGNVPDIITTGILSYDILPFLNDGLLTDMSTYIEKDDEFGRDMFYSGIIDAFRYDNKMYELPLIITIRTSKLPKCLKTDKCLDMIDKISSMYSPDDYFIDSGFSNDMIQIYMNEKTDFANRSFNISETDITKIVSFIRKYDNDLQGTDNISMDRKSIRDPHFFTGQSDIFYGFRDKSDDHFLGYSGKDGIVTSRLGMAITEKCENKEVAWEFIKICCKSIEKHSDEELYSLKSLNTCSDDDINEKFNSFMEGEFLAPMLHHRSTNIIYNEIVMNPDISDEELSKAICGKMKLYFAEIQ